MEFEEFRQRLEAARTRAALRRLQAIDVLATNQDLRRESGEAVWRERARRRGEDGEIDMQPNSISPLDRSSAGDDSS
jgi:hypothetical protein